ncbi:hypothetical protein AB0L04_28935 [Streptomyces glaucescens]|uniref:hypothetical protein n=1 Tax=Streptomyces glaucescens TaxID=1907 RepID=UPI00344CCA97
MATTVIAPIVVAVVAGAVGLGVTGGFSWLAEKFEGEKQPIHVSGTRSPRVIQSPTAAPSTPAGEAGSGSSATPATPSPSNDPVDQDAALGEGLNVGRSAYECPWDVWVVKTPPSELVDPPVSGREVNRSLVSYRNAGDPDRTVLSMLIQPEDDRPLVIKEVRVKVIERKQPPGMDEATVLGLLTAGCGGGVDQVRAHADLDGGGQYARVVLTSGTATLPWEITDGRMLEVQLTVSTRRCDCTWVPEIIWAKDGKVHTTQWLQEGAPFRTIPSAGYQRIAWELKYEGQPGIEEDTWQPLPFDERLLD